MVCRTPSAQPPGWGGLQEDCQPRQPAAQLPGHPGQAHSTPVRGWQHLSPIHKPRKWWQRGDGTPQPSTSYNSLRPRTLLKAFPTPSQLPSGFRSDRIHSESSLTSKGLGLRECLRPSFLPRATLWQKGLTVYSSWAKLTKGLMEHALSPKGTCYYVESHL